MTNKYMTVMYVRFCYKTEELLVQYNPDFIKIYTNALTQK